MTEGQRGRTGARWVGEAIVIVVSVFVAIYLEGAAGDAERVDEANGVLAQIAAELAADRHAIPEILEQQAVAAGTYESLLRWLADSRSVPGDSVQVALDYLRDNNRTLYPISGAWRALISGGHLVWIRDQGLVARLAAFYENRTVQVEYNGRDYDFNLNDVLRVTASRAWDFERQSPRVNGSSGLVELSGQLRHLGASWNPYYTNLLDEYGTEIDALLVEIESYLSGGGDSQQAIAAVAGYPQGAGPLAFGSRPLSDGWAAQQNAETLCRAQRASRCDPRIQLECGAASKSPWRRTIHFGGTSSPGSGMSWPQHSPLGLSPSITSAAHQFQASPPSR